jgi:hypothetical protein
MPDKHQHSGNMKNSIMWPDLKGHLKKYPGCKEKSRRHSG